MAGDEEYLAFTFELTEASKDPHLSYISDNNNLSIFDEPQAPAADNEDNFLYSILDLHDDTSNLREELSNDDFPIIPDASFMSPPRQPLMTPQILYTPNHTTTTPHSATPSTPLLHHTQPHLQQTSPLPTPSPMQGSGQRLIVNVVHQVLSPHERMLARQHAHRLTNINPVDSHLYDSSPSSPNSNSSSAPPSPSHNKRKKTGRYSVPRNQYKCSKCHQLKKGHTCRSDAKPQTNIDLIEEEEEEDDSQQEWENYENTIVLDKTPSKIRKTATINSLREDQWATPSSVTKKANSSISQPSILRRSPRAPHPVSSRDFTYR